jgi:hypothetical protein
MTALLTAPPALPTAGPATRGRTLLEIPPVEFERHFSREPFLLGHRLTQHPLFDIDRLLQLAQSLPSECIEYNAGNLPTCIDPALTPRNGLSVQETIRRIAECRSWLVLKYVERDPHYRDLLEECLQEVRPHSEPIAPGMMHPQAFIFVTSPGSVTPFHIDPEHNFLLQIRGSKRVRMLDGRDRGIVSEEDLENFYGDRGRNLRLKPVHEDAGWTFELQPGQGLHFPVTYPHWVQNGDAVSISFSITFRTPDLDRRRALYRMNGDWRRRGWRPWSVGCSRLRDDLAYLAYRARRKVATLGQREACCDAGRRGCGG